MGTPHLISAEELQRMPDEPPYELVLGQLVPVSQPGAEHGELAVIIAAALRGFVQTRRLGTVFVETGYLLHRQPDTVRGPDVSFVTRDRLQALGKGSRVRGYIPGAPDLAVEIRSPDQSSQKLSEKAAEYLAAGAHLVWVVDPIAGTARVYAPGRPVKLLTEADSLEGERVLPGFSLPLGELFAAPD